MSRKPTGRAVRLASIGGLMALLLMACSNGAQNALPSGEKGDYVRQVQPICKDVSQELTKPLGADPAHQADVLAHAREQLQAIPVPDQDLTSLTMFRVQFSNVAYSMEDAAQGLALGDHARADQSVQAAKNVVRQLHDTAEDNDFGACTQLFTG